MAMRHHLGGGPTSIASSSLAAYELIIMIHADMEVDKVVQNMAERMGGLSVEVIHIEDDDVDDDVVYQREVPAARQPQPAFSQLSSTNTNEAAGTMGVMQSAVLVAALRHRDKELTGFQTEAKRQKEIKYIKDHLVTLRRGNDFEVSVREDPDENPADRMKAWLWKLTRNDNGESVETPKACTAAGPVKKGPLS